MKKTSTYLSSRKRRIPLLSALLCSFFISSLPCTAQSNFTLYGLTVSGGQYNVGTAFSCSPAGTVTTLYSFSPAYGESPYGSLIKGFDGNLYGMTESGGIYSDGTIFKMSLSGSLNTLANFAGLSNGANGFGSLYQDVDSSFYGMTYNGGVYNSCVCFRCSPSGVISVIFDFLTSTGDFPYGNVMKASDGNFYGMTTAGGNNGLGIIWIKKPGDTLTKVYDFSTSSGGLPYGSLIEGTDGKLYGMTSGRGWQSPYGNLGHLTGAAKFGTIFSYFNDTLTTLHLFDSLHGAYPYGSLLQASDGNFYGMTSSGGTYHNENTSSFGTLFMCTPSGTFTSLVNFNNTNGANPHGSLIEATDTCLYGMTLYGGSYNKGTLFKYSLATGLLSTLFNFDSLHGTNPYGDLLMVADYTTGNDGSNNKYMVNLFPNPVSDNFIISVNGISEKAQVQFFNLLGQQVYNAAINPGNNQFSFGTKPSGIYLYRITDLSGNLIKEGKIAKE